MLERALRRAVPKYLTFPVPVFVRKHTMLERALRPALDGLVERGR